MVKTRFVSILLMTAVLILAVSERAVSKPYCERLYDAARKDYYSLLDSERKQRFHDSWEKVIGKFSLIADKS